MISFQWTSSNYWRIKQLSENFEQRLPQIVGHLHNLKLCFDIHIIYTFCMCIRHNAMLQGLGLCRRGLLPPPSITSCSRPAGPWAATPRPGRGTPTPGSRQRSTTARDLTKVSFKCFQYKSFVCVAALCNAWLQLGCSYRASLYTTTYCHCHSLFTSYIV